MEHTCCSSSSLKEVTRPDPYLSWKGLTTAVCWPKTTTRRINAESIFSKLRPPTVCQLGLPRSLTMLEATICEAAHLNYTNPAIRVAASFTCELIGRAQGTKIYLGGPYYTARAAAGQRRWIPRCCKPASRWPAGGSHSGHDF